MTSFNEASTTENAVVGSLAKLAPLRWDFTYAPDLPRSEADVMVESWVRDALIALNPEIAGNPEYAEDVVYKLRGILIGARSDGLVKANEEFARWLRGEHSMPFGANGQHVPVRLIDFEKPANNRFVVAQQYTYRPAPKLERRMDIVLLVNGMPLVVGEVKTPVRPAVSWADGAKDFVSDYWKSIPNLFVPNVLCFATEGREYRYGSVSADHRFWHAWRLTEDRDFDLPGLPAVLTAVNRMLKPEVVLELLEAFTIYPSTGDGRKTKVIARYPQYEGAKQIVDRVVEGRKKRGLIWHFQGSGKSFLMVFAAQLLRAQQELRNPTVIIVVDRVDLDQQIGATFDAADVANVTKARTRGELETLLRQDTRQTIVTTIFKFAEAGGVLNERDNIILLVDEAHRTQEGDLGRKMRESLPNSFMFGLTGTPISRRDKNTYVAFGDPDDPGGYLNHYSYKQAIRDGATLEVRFEPRLVEMRIDREAIDDGFDELADAYNLSEAERADLSKRAGKLAVLLKNPDRMAAIANDISEHFTTRIQPTDLKGMVVTIDREACVRMKQLLDELLGPEATEIVMTTNQSDVIKWKKRGVEVAENDWRRWNTLDSDRTALARLIDRYRDPLDPLLLLIVTNKLLTGFDAPICQVMYLDQALRDHNLLQAICRTNRPYPDKQFGLIVDYLGVFDEIARALDYDPDQIERVITNFQELKSQFPGAILKVLSHFEGVDRTIGGYEGLIAAQDCLPSKEARDEFARDFSIVSQLWEAVDPDPMLSPFEEDYRWLSQVYESVRPTSGIGTLLWASLGAKTLQLVHDNVSVESLRTDLDTLVLDADLTLGSDNPDREGKRVELTVRGRLWSHRDDPRFEELGMRLERLRDEYEQGVLDALSWLKELLSIARDVVKAEQETPHDIIEDGKHALSQIFEEARTDKTPEMIARIVDDIDALVKVTRFDGWQSTRAGDREVQKAIRSTLLKYQLHRDQDLFDRVLGYVRQHY